MIVIHRLKRNYGLNFPAEAWLPSLKMRLAAA